MFTRQVFRSVQPLRSSIRPYATAGPTGGDSSKWSTRHYAIIAALTIPGFFFVKSFVDSPKPKPSSTTNSNPPLASDPTPTNKSNPPLASDSTPSPSTFLGGEQGWVDLKLENVEELSHNTKKFRFALPSKDDASGLKVASALLAKYQGPGMEKPVIRPYTPTSDEDTRGHIDFVVKKYPDGPMSSHFHEMEPNQRLDFKGPIPKYPWEPNKHNHIALIAGGTGITPMWQLCRAIFKNPEDKTKVTLVFGNVKEEDILLKREFQDLENTFPQRFRAFYVLDTPSESWTQGTGRITEEVLKTVLPEPKEENIKVFVCGPPGLYKAISGNKTSPADQGELSGYLKALGYSKEQVYKF